MLGGLRKPAALAVFTALLAALGAGCSNNTNSDRASGSAQAPCDPGSFCVRLDVTGATSGRLNTTPPPANFDAECATTVPVHGEKTWVSHQFGRFNGQTWLLDIEAANYKAPGTYPVTVTLSEQGSTGSRVTYFGQGSATLQMDGTAAKLSARLNEIPAQHKSLSVVGTISCTSLVQLR